MENEKMNTPIPERKPDFNAVFSDTTLPAAAGSDVAVIVDQPNPPQTNEAAGVPGSSLLPMLFIGYLFYRYVKGAKIASAAKARADDDEDVVNGIVSSVIDGSYYKGLSNDDFGNAAAGINLAKDERILFAAPSKYYRDRVIKHYEGRSAGTTIRLAGMPIRLGASKGRPIDVRETIFESDGVFVLTTRAVYFNGNKKSVRILLGKIISYKGEADHVVIQRDAETAYPQRFTVPGSQALIVEALLDDATTGVTASKISMVVDHEDDVTPEMTLAMRDAN